MTLDAERANRTSVTGVTRAAVPGAPHLRLHVVFDVELVGFLGEGGRLEVVVEDDVDVCDGAFFRALLRVLGGGVGSDQSAVDAVVFPGHPLDKRGQQRSAGGGGATLTKREESSHAGSLNVPFRQPRRTSHLRTT